MYVVHFSYWHASTYSAVLPSSSSHLALIIESLIPSDANVLKIKPPLVFGRVEVDLFISGLERAILETES